MLDNYRKFDSWLTTPEITKSTFENLENIMIDSNELDKYVNFEDMIYEIN